jgi:hypothetical protein
MIEKAAKEVPYVFSVPETYEELTGDELSVALLYWVP